MKDKIEKKQARKECVDIRKKVKTPFFLDGALVAMFTAMIAVCAWISIPLPGGVSVTLQTFAVFLAVGTLGLKRGTLSVIVYVLLGAVGVPVFSLFKGGLAVLVGQTGGYIFGFVLSALVCGAICLAAKNRIWVLIVGMVAGLLVCYAVGTAWFYYIYTRDTGAVSVMTVLGWCVFPFIIPDAVKIVLAAIITNRVRRYISF